MKTKKRVFITGIGGFIGGYLAIRLVADGYEVHGLYQNELPERDDWDGTTSHVGELLDFDRIAS